MSKTKPPSRWRCEVRDLRSLVEAAWKPDIKRPLSLAAALTAAAGVAQAAPQVAAPSSDRHAPIVRQSRHALTGADTDYRPLISSIGEARFVLLGESTHGTEDFYAERARISEQLVQERGFRAIILEADGPEIERVDRYVRGSGEDESGNAALADIKRWPTWMWRNTAFLGFVERLRSWNLARPPQQRVGVYGMDVNSLFESIDGTVAFLDAHDPAGAAFARAQFRCFRPYRRDAAAYGRAARRADRSCQDEAAAVLAQARSWSAPGEAEAAETQFAALRNAAAVVAGEAYFRAVHAGSYSWNIRDEAMTDAIQDVVDHLASLSGEPGKVIVWAHNTHVGDARATDSARRGEVNVGQLLRERHGQDVYSVGFLTFQGAVTAAPEWDRPPRQFVLPPALEGSDAARLHGLGLDRSLLVLRSHDLLQDALRPTAPQRAVGVVYDRKNEHQAHYIEASLSEQFDALVYLDKTKALTPLPH